VKTFAAARALLLVLVLGALLPVGAVAQQAPECHFAHGFAALRDRLVAEAGADVVGSCREDERPASDGAVQATALGVLHWRRADNATSFVGHDATWTLDADGLRRQEHAPADAAARHDRLGFAPGISYLFSLGAGGGTYAALPEGGFRVTLTAPDADVVWFSNRPQRLSGHRPVATFVEWWDAFGFGDVPPNAVLSLPAGEAGRDTLVFSMDRPALNADGSLTFTGAALPDDAPRTETLHAHAARADADLPAAFGRAVLFVDDAAVALAQPCPNSGPHLPTCTIYTFPYRGQVEHWQVPAGQDEITIIAAGAKGGDSRGWTDHVPKAGGAGAQVQGNFNVSPGQVLTILVGGRGQGSSSSLGGGGGGGSFVWVGTGPAADDNLMIAAGGGGGAATGDAGQPGQVSEAGGAGTRSHGGAGGQGGQGGRVASAYDGEWAGAAGGGLLGAGDVNPQTRRGAAWGGDAIRDGGRGGQGGCPPGGAGGYGGGGGSSCYGIVNGPSVGAGGGGGGYSGGGAGGQDNGDGPEWGLTGAGGGGGSFNRGCCQSSGSSSQADGVVKIIAVGPPGPLGPLGPSTASPSARPRPVVTPARR
jgi:hypothetical protein